MILDISKWTNIKQDFLGESPTLTPKYNKNLCNIRSAQFVWGKLQKLSIRVTKAINSLIC